MPRASTSPDTATLQLYAVDPPAPAELRGLLELDPATLQTRRQVQDPRVSQFALSPDGKHLVSYQPWARNNPLVHLWDSTSLKLFRSFRGHTNRVTSIAWPPDSRSFYSISEDQTLFQWPTGEP